MNSNRLPAHVSRLDGIMKGRADKLCIPGWCLNVQGMKCERMGQAVEPALDEERSGRERQLDRSCSGRREADAVSGETTKSEGRMMRKGQYELKMGLLSKGGRGRAGCKKFDAVTNCGASSDFVADAASGSCKLSLSTG